MANRSMSVPMTLSDPNSGFKVTVEYLKNGASHGKSYCRTYEPYTIYRMVPLSMTLSDL